MESKMESTDQEEPILTPEMNRFVIYPPVYHDLWEMYKKHEKTNWVAEEIDYSADLNDWESLSSNERHFIEHILAFFAGSDGIVLENLLGNFSSEVKISEARAFYAFQSMIENVHSLTYALLIDTLVKDADRKSVLFNAIEEIPVVKKKANWAIRWMDPATNSFATRLIAFAIVEGVFFSGAFCSIFWLKDKNKMVKALGHSNELISRDEGLHVEFAVKLFHHLVHKPSEKTVTEIMKDAVVLEKEFICDAIPCDMIGMNSALMCEYIEFVSDRLMTQLGYSKIYNSANPFRFMEKIGLEGKTNFFEKRVSEYQISTGHNKSDNTTYDTSSDF